MWYIFYVLLWRNFGHMGFGNLCILYLFTYCGTEVVFSLFAMPPQAETVAPRLTSINLCPYHNMTAFMSFLQFLKIIYYTDPGWCSSGRVFSVCYSNLSFLTVDLHGRFLIKVLTSHFLLKYFFKLLSKHETSVSYFKLWGTISV